MSLARAGLALALSLAAAVPAFAQSQTIRVGVTPGPHAQILEAAKPLAAKAGLDIKIVEFSDYVVPNQALEAGEIEANSFQHLPYLENQKADRGFKIEAVAQTVNFPMGIYSTKLKSLDAIPNGGRIAIPNDPTNGGRALLLLADKGLIRFKGDVGFKPSPADIVDNPKRLRFVELDAAQIPRSLPDVDAAVANTNYASQAGLDPVKDAIARENPKGPYVNVIAVRSADKDKPWVKTLVEAYRSPEVKSFVDTKFGGAVLTSW
jgi:D-methionine transport system substrate-binding protein